MEKGRAIEREKEMATTRVASTQEIIDLKAEIERLNHELNKSAAFGLELLKEKDNLHKQLVKANHDLQDAVNKQRDVATTVFEKEVQLLNDSDALNASFSQAKQDFERELKQKDSLLEGLNSEKERYLNERDELAKRLSHSEKERKNLKIELKDAKQRETKLLDSFSELEEENLSLQKQVSSLRSAQVEFESSKHEVQRLQDEVTALNSRLDEMLSLKNITDRQMQEALEALQNEREQKYAFKKELDKKNSTEHLMNWTSLAAEMNTIEQTILDSTSNKIESTEVQSEDVQSLRNMLYKKQEQLRQLRTVLKSNKESAEVALKNLKSKYEMEKAIVAETMNKLRLEHKRLLEDAATFASLRSQFSARIEEYNSEIEKLQSQLTASEQEKTTLNSILRMAVEQKVMLTQKIEAMELNRQNKPHGKRVG